jgi:hypothetical protein
MQQVRKRQLTHDVEEVLGQDLGALVDGLAGTVEHTTEHVLGHRGSENVTGELAGGVASIDARCALEDLGA